MILALAWSVLLLLSHQRELHQKRAKQMPLSWKSLSADDEWNGTFAASGWMVYKLQDPYIFVDSLSSVDHNIGAGAKMMFKLIPEMDDVMCTVASTVEDVACTILAATWGVNRKLQYIQRVVKVSIVTRPNDRYNDLEMG
jgi:hypothetical protein